MPSVNCRRNLLNCEPCQQHDPLHAQFPHRRNIHNTNPPLLSLPKQPSLLKGRFDTLPLPPPGPHPPPRTFAQVAHPPVTQSLPPRPQQSVTDAPSRPRRLDGIQHTSAERKQFRLHLPSHHFPGLSGSNLITAVDSLLHAHLIGGTFTVVDVHRLRGWKRGVSRLLIFVGTLADAASLVSMRHAFKGSAMSLHDVLSVDEQQAHDQLWPSFLAARARNEKAQFQRGRLYVNGIEVPPPLG